jgi:hypothetical protein
MHLTPSLAATWWGAVCAAWWEAWVSLWDDVGAAVRGEYWPDAAHEVDYPDIVDAHVDFGGGDE